MHMSLVVVTVWRHERKIQGGMPKKKHNRVLKGPASRERTWLVLKFEVQISLTLIQCVTVSED